MFLEQEYEAESEAGGRYSNREYIRWLQAGLNQLSGAGLRVDGIFGQNTRRALRAFQERAGVRPLDGLPGPISEAALIRGGLNPPPGSRTIAPPTPSPSPGASVDHFIVRQAALPAPATLQVDNFQNPGMHRFVHGSRRTGRPVTEMIVHETVTRSVQATIDVLVRRKLSVQLILGPDGAITQHGDLGDDLHWHAGNHNLRSVGVEVVNPYEPRFLRPGLPWSQSIPAGWAAGGRYVLPTPAQAEATSQLLNWITSPSARGLTIPRTWIGVANGRMHMNRVPGATGPRPGIYAHCYFHHADGAWLVLYAWLRLEAGFPPADAYQQAVQRASIRSNIVTLP